MKKIYLIGFVLMFLASCTGAFKSQSDSPASVLKTFLQAKINKDAEGQKNSVSKNSLKFLEETAKKQNKTVDQLLTDDAGMKLIEIPEIGKEEIAGETATVELKNPNAGTWEKMPFVKEDGKWKIALDKAFEEAMKKVQELMKQMPSNSIENTNGNEKTEEK